MILFGFCIELKGEPHEAAAWAEDVDAAFSLLTDSIEFQLLRPLIDGEVEWCELATYDGSTALVWWLEAAEA